jgi:hypothetical protein
VELAAAEKLMLTSLLMLFWLASVCGPAGCCAFRGPVVVGALIFEFSYHEKTPNLLTLTYSIQRLTPKIFQRTQSNNLDQKL